MEAQQSPWLSGFIHLANKDRRITGAIVILALLFLVNSVSASGHDSSPSAADALPTVAATATISPSPTAPPQATATPSKKSAIPQHAQPTAMTIPVATATSTEAETPLTLTDPTTDTVSYSDTPWWQGAIDVLWKLGIVVVLIYLAMRGLDALKKNGFTPSVRPGVKGERHDRRFFEQIEEIRLTPQHSLHAVRAGDRIFLLARTSGAIRPLGEFDMGESETGLMEALPGGFSRQLLQAWGGALPPSTEETPSEPTQESTTDRPEEITSAIDAKWVMVEPDAELPPQANLAEPPVRKGTARPSDAPAPPEILDQTTRREILWYAEEHGVGEAAKRYGLTPQKVTAIRVKHDRERSGQATEKVRPAAKTPTIRANVEVPHNPTKSPKEAEKTQTKRIEPDVTPLDSARATLASKAYKETTNTPTVKKVAAPQPDSLTPEQATTVGQVLAARFGIKIPASPGK